MKYSECIENFLDLLRNCYSDYNIVVMREKEANDKTQDLLHNLELQSNTYHDLARISKALSNVRQERRRAKDMKAQLAPIVDWLLTNEKTIKDLERLLGAVRKAERSLEGRMYIPKTDIIEQMLGTKNSLNDSDANQ